MAVKLSGLEVTDECLDDRTNAYIGDTSEYKCIIWNEQIVCSKRMQIQIQIESTFFF